MRQYPRRQFLLDLSFYSRISQAIPFGPAFDSNDDEEVVVCIE